MPKPSLSDLSPTSAPGPAGRTRISPSRRCATCSPRSPPRVTRNNLVRQRAFSERIAELMNKYTNQQLTSAEVIAELVELAKEVAAEGNRGQRFTPPLDDDELAFYDAVSTERVGVESRARTSSRRSPASWWP